LYHCDTGTRARELLREASQNQALPPLAAARHSHLFLVLTSMSKLHAYLEKYFPASLWDPLGGKDVGEATASEASTSAPSTGAGTSYRRKNHVKTGDLTYLPSIQKGDRWNEDDVRRTFMENFGVSVRIVVDRPAGSVSDVVSCHFLFKYYVILQAKSTWLADDTGVLADCRGTILQCELGVGWRIAARPFEKFFNQQEIACPVHIAASFDTHVKEYEFVEKADGTMMVLWYRRFPGGGTDSAGWQWSTSTGLLAEIRWIRAVTPFLHIKSAAKEIESEISADQQTNVIDEALLDTKCTYVFELCSKDTQVITKYATERIYLLGVLDSATGETSTQNDLDRIASSLNILRPQRYNAQAEGIDSLKRALQWIEEQAAPEKSVGKFGDWPEGFVVYYQSRPICKLKNRAYNDRHAFYASDLLHMRNLMIERYFTGTTDDVLAFCPPAIVAFVDEMTKKVQDLMKIAVMEQARLVDTIAKTLKDVPQNERPAALVELLRSDPSIQRHSLPKFFLKYRNILTAESTPAAVEEAFMTWIDQNWRSLVEYWRATSVPELIEEDKLREKERLRKPNMNTNTKKETE